MLRHLVVAIFTDKQAADAAVVGLKDWDAREDEQTMVNTNRLQSVGVLVLDEHGKLKAVDSGSRSIGTGAAIGLVLAMLTPVGLAVGILGGGVLGALHHKHMWIPDEDRERLGQALQGGRAAVGVVTDATSAAAISSQLAALGGTPETHELDEAALAELAATPATPGEPAEAVTPA
jgi:hypothetical protein